MVRLPYFADPANLVVEEDEKPEDGPEGETSLQLLQTVYRDRKQPLNVRVRCAIEALQHEYGKVSAVKGKRESFADELEKATLERAIARSQSSLPAFNGPVPELPPTVAQKPFVRSNYRRF
jgi:hypothetical protein